MRAQTRTVLGGLATVSLAAMVAACSNAGDLEISNNGPADVTVVVDDEEIAVTADGGVVLLGYGCTPGDVTVEFSSGETATVTGPVCPDQRIVVGDGTVTLRPDEADA